MNVTRSAAAVMFLTFVGILGAQPARITADADKDFVKSAASSGLLEVDLGTHVSTNASKPDVQQLGKHMVQDHQKANDELIAILKQKGEEIPKDLSEKHKEMKQKFLGLQGNELDKEYPDQMVKNHEESITIFQKFIEEGQDAELKSFATRSLPTLEEHLEMAKDVQAGRPMRQATADEGQVESKPSGL